MPLQSRGGLLSAKLLAKGVFVLGFDAIIETRRNPALQHQPAAQVDAAKFFSGLHRILAERRENRCFSYENSADSGC